MKSLKLVFLIFSISLIAISCNQIAEIEEEVLKEIKELLFLGDEPTPSPTPDAAPIPVVKAGVWDIIKSALGAISTSWPTIIKNFKTTKTSSVKERLVGKGFTYFSQSAQIQVSKGISEENYDKFIAIIAKRLKVPEERKEDLGDVLETAKYAEKQAWVAFNTLYSLDKIGNTKYATIMVAKDENTGKYDMIISDIIADFQFAPDVVIVNKKLSVLGGIFENDKDEIISVPKNVTQEDMQTVLSFFEIIAYQTIAKYMKIDLELPK